MKLDEIISEERGYVDELRRRFKRKMSEEMFEDDSLFQRFLRARNYDLDAAENMLRDHLKWRQSKNVDSIFEYNSLEVLKKYLSVNFIGYDKEGFPVGYTQMGELDTRGVLKSATKEEIQTYVIKYLEDCTVKLKEQTEKRGKPVDKLVYIFNVENLSFSLAAHKPTMETLISLAQMYERNYPERLKLCIFINASFIFTFTWAMIKPFLSGPTAQKVMIYGKDGWQNDLLSYIDADVLPAFIGGNRTDPDGDPKCRSVITSFGGIVPESYYMEKYLRKPSIIPGGKTAMINRLSKTELKFEVNVPNSIIQWEFLVKNRDIAFSLLYKDDADHSSEFKSLITKQRREVHEGVYTCKQTGIYILEFDNTFSWMHGKEVQYKVSVSRPDQE